MYGLLELPEFPATFTGITGKSATFSFLSLPQDVKISDAIVSIVSIFFMLLILKFIFWNTDLRNLKNLKNLILL
jgi:hypothetical protein